MKNTHDYFRYGVDYISVVENSDPTQGQGVCGFSSQLVLALPGHSVHNVLLFSVNRDQKVKARGVIPHPCKDVARTMRRATRL